jgi:hypothetical protein
MFSKLRLGNINILFSSSNQKYFTLTVNYHVYFTRRFFSFHTSRQTVVGPQLVPLHLRDVQMFFSAIWRQFFIIDIPCYVAPRLAAYATNEPKIIPLFDSQCGGGDFSIIPKFDISWSIYKYIKYNHCVNLGTSHWQTKWTMSPIGLTVSCKSPPPNSGMHWLRFPIRTCIDSHPRIRAYMDSGGKQERFVSFRKWFYVITSWNDVIASTF